MELILKKVQKKHLALIAELARTLKIEVASADSEYDPNFVSKIEKSEEDFKAGKFKAIKTSELWK